MQNPTKPDLTGKLQVKSENKYVDTGELALWSNNDSKYLLRGYVTIDGTRYLVSLKENGE
jgi:hypothetical protein